MGVVSDLWVGYYGLFKFHKTCAQFMDRMWVGLAITQQIVGKIFAYEGRNLNYHLVIEVM
jgi:hypothetical protein